MNTTMTTIITTVTVAVLTLIFQKAFSNFAKGFSIFITRPFKKGQKIALRTAYGDIVSGRIIKINMHHIALKAYNNDVYIVNNSQLDNYIVVNSDAKDGMNHTESVSFVPNSDIIKIKEILNDIIINNKQTLNTPENTRLISKIDNGKLVIQYNVKTNDVNESYKVCSKICDELIIEFAKHNIIMA